MHELRRPLAREGRLWRLGPTLPRPRGTGTPRSPAHLVAPCNHGTVTPNSAAMRFRGPRYTWSGPPPPGADRHASPSCAGSLPTLAERALRSQKAQPCIERKPIEVDQHREGDAVTRRHCDGAAVEGVRERVGRQRDEQPCSCSPEEAHRGQRRQRRDEGQAHGKVEPGPLVLQVRDVPRLGDLGEGGTTAGRQAPARAIRRRSGPALMISSSARWQARRSTRTTSGRGC
jgi:hypothetical protein